MANSDKLRKYKSLYSSTTNSFGTGTSETITPQSVVGLPTDTNITLTFDRVDSSGTATPSKMERIKGLISGGNFVIEERGVDGTTEQAHTTPVVEMIWNATDWNDAVAAFLVGHSQNGSHASSIVTLTASQTLTNKTLTSPTISGTVSGNITFTGTITGAGAATWTAFSGAYASGTTITVSGTDVTGIMKKGVVLKWQKSDNTFKTGMVISSSFSTDTTITIVGSTVESGDKNFYYGPLAYQETFIIPGALASGTDMSKTVYAPEAIYPISVDARLKSNISASECIFDVNDDGTSIITTKPTIAASGVSDLNNVVAAPTTAIAQNSAITVDVDQAVSGPVEAYIDLFYYPVNLVSRT